MNLGSNYKRSCDLRAIVIFQKGTESSPWVLKKNQLEKPYPNSSCEKEEYDVLNNQSEVKILKK